MRSRIRKGITHCIFDSEAEYRDFFGDSAQPIHVNWREAPEGSWVWSDDGKIVQILKRRAFSKRGPAQDYVQTIVGSFVCYPQYKMDTVFENHPDPYVFFGVSNRIKDRSKLSQAERQFIRLIMEGYDKTSAYRIAFPKAVSKSYIRQTIKKLFQQERFLVAMTAEAKKAAKKLGLNVEYILNAYMDILQKKETPARDAITAVDRLADIIEVKPELPASPQGTFTPYEEVRPDELASIERKVLGDGNGKDRKNRTDDWKEESDTDAGRSERITADVE